MDLENFKRKVISQIEKTYAVNHFKNFTQVMPVYLNVNERSREVIWPNTSPNDINDWFSPDLFYGGCEFEIRTCPKSQDPFVHIPREELNRMFYGYEESEKLVRENPKLEKEPLWNLFPAVNFRAKRPWLSVYIPSQTRYLTFPSGIIHLETKKDWYTLYNDKKNEKIIRFIENHYNESIWNWIMPGGKDAKIKKICWAYLDGNVSNMLVYTETDAIWWRWWWAH